MRLLLLAFTLMTAAPLSAEYFIIPAEEFDWHTRSRDMSGYTQDAELENVRLLGVGDQLHIRHWIDTGLRNYTAALRDKQTIFEVCVTVANLDEGQTNKIRIHHLNSQLQQLHTLESNQYSTLCSMQGTLDEVARSAGVKVVSGSQGSVEVRNVIFRIIKELAPLTTETTSSWELDLHRSPQSIRPNGRPTYVTNQQAWAVLTIGDVVYVGGEFMNIKKGDVFAEPARKYIAAFNRNTGNPIPGFNIELDGPVFALASSPNNDTLYVGGAFNKADGKNRRKFAALDIADGSATVSNFRLKRDGEIINPDRALRDIAVTDDILYVAGSFTRE